MLEGCRSTGVRVRRMTTQSNGHRIDGYSIKKKLGSGGMATVYLAVQTSLGRKVALKLLSPNLTQDSSSTVRFLREARTIADLSHPNIISIYDVGTTNRHLPYFTMQYLSGGDLSERLKKTLTEKEIIRVLMGVTEALGYAHRRNFIHRDVKPANILFDESDNPILTDFGIARTITGSNWLTGSGRSVGSSHYMSPEQTQGAELDARSDIYSLGVVAYQALVGRAPYEADDDYAIGYAHVYHDIPEVPERLERWQSFIARAMAKNPDDRFQHTDEVQVALRELLEATSDTGRASHLREADTVPLAPVPESETGPLLNPDQSDPITTFQPEVEAQTELQKSFAETLQLEQLNAQQKDEPGSNERTTLRSTPLPTDPTVRLKPLDEPSNPPVDPPSELPVSSRRRINPIGLTLVLTALIVVVLLAVMWSGNDTHDDPPDATVLTPVPQDSEPSLETEPSIDPSLELAVDDEPAETPDSPSRDDMLISDQGGFESEQGTDSYLSTLETLDTSAVDLFGNSEQEEPVDETYFDDLFTVNSQTEAVDELSSVSDPQQEQDIDDTLRLAAEDLEASRLTTPRDSNAFSRYQSVLAIDPDNQEARTGISNIVDRYQGLARSNARRNMLDKAHTYLKRARQVMTATGLRNQAAEVDQLSEQLVEEARLRADQLIEQGQMSPARTLLTQILLFLPDDADILASIALIDRPPAVEPSTFSDTLADGSSGPRLYRLKSGDTELFSIGLSEVTRSEFEQFSQSSEYRNLDSRIPCRDQESIWRSSKRRTWKNPGFEQQPGEAVTCINYHAAEAYVNWLSAQTGHRYQLPTIDQWQDVLSRLPIEENGCTIDNLADQSFSRQYPDESSIDCNDGATHTAAAAVSSERPTYLAGNLREWTRSCADAGCAERIAVGGSWFNALSVEDARKTRMAVDPDRALNTLGFRVIRLPATANE